MIDDKLSEKTTPEWEVSVTLWVRARGVAEVSQKVRDYINSSDYCGGWAFEVKEAMVKK